MNHTARHSIQVLYCLYCDILLIKTNPIVSEKALHLHLRQYIRLINAM